MHVWLGCAHLDERWFTVSSIAHISLGTQLTESNALLQ